MGVLNNGDSIGALERINGHWSGSMAVLKRVNGGVGQGQWGMEKEQLRHGLGFGSERDVAVGQTGGCLAGL